MLETLTGTHADWVLGIARIVLGVIFFGHGAQKMLGWYGGQGLASSMRAFTEHLHLPSTLAFLVIAGEFLGGIGLIVGLFSRIAALIIALTMVGAIATVHFRFGLFLDWFGSRKGHGIEYHLLVIALALVVVVKGAGAFSLDGFVHEHVSRLEQSVTGSGESQWSAAAMNASGATANAATSPAPVLPSWRLGSVAERIGKSRASASYGSV